MDVTHATYSALLQLISLQTVKLITSFFLFLYQMNNLNNNRTIVIFRLKIFSAQIVLVMGVLLHVNCYDARSEDNIQQGTDG